MNKLYNSKWLFISCFSFMIAMMQLPLMGQSNQYLHFDGNNDFVEVPIASKYIAGADGVTMAGWFYCDALQYGKGMTGFRNGGSGDGEMYLIQLNNGLLECRYIVNGATSEVVAPAFTVIPEVWQHYAWVHDGSNVTLYLDGEVVGSAISPNGPITSEDTPLSIGSHISPFNFYFNGRIDEYSLWSKGLTQAEVQDMIANELQGNEPNLELYYKFNQGVPGADNTSITNLISEVGGGQRDGILTDFALVGETSNFGGELDVTFQAIAFPAIPNKLTTDEPFTIAASASSGLAVEFAIVSGPASISGNTITLDGTPGTVVVRASQAGDGTFGPASEIDVVFEVLDPMTFTPEIEDRSPYFAADVFVPELRPIQLATIANIDYPELFSVGNVFFEIGDTVIEATDWGNDHYTAYWLPPAHGSYTLNIRATNNYGANNVLTLPFNVIDQMDNTSVNAFSDVHVFVNDSEETVTATLPCYLGAFNQIVGNLTIGCEGGDCDPWDRVSSIEAKGHNGEWYEIIRYITPFGIACNSEIDLTDFMSALQGKIDFRVTLVTFDNGFLYSLDLDYTGGAPAYNYSSIQKLWNATYDFGNPSNLQPTEALNPTYPENTIASRIKLVSSGHGWGDNNTDNAAEFSNNTHHIWVGGEQTFAQNNWASCDPNPDGCNNQLGTWEFNRAGWCPGSIAPWFDFDLINVVAEEQVELGYVFDEGYVDLCNSNNPDCVTGVTCLNCDDGFNPHLIVSSYLINKGNLPLGATFTVTDTIEMPIDSMMIDTMTSISQVNKIKFNVYPNPSSGIFNIDLNQLESINQITIINVLGQTMHVFNKETDGDLRTLDLSDLSDGIYMMELLTKNGRGLKKITISNN